MPEQIGQVLTQALRESDKRRRFVLPVRGDEGGYVAKRNITRAWEEVEPRLRALLEQLRVGERRWPLYLWGDTGRGKTCAALAFCDRLAFARYWTVGDVMDEMAKREPPWECERWYWGGRPSTPHLTVLDELGMSQRDFEYDAVKRFCDWRENMPTIYISNHPPTAKQGTTIADVYDKRIHSRVTCGTVCELVGPDRRFATAPPAGKEPT